MHYNSHIICRIFVEFEEGDCVPKKAKWIIGILAAILLLEAAAAFGYLGYWRPYQKAVNTMPESGEMTLTRQPEGTLTLSWPEGTHQDRYLLQVLDGEAVLFEDWFTEPGCTLPRLPEDKQLQLRVSTARGYRFPFLKEERLRMGETDLRVTAQLQMPAIEDLSWTPDPGTQTVKLQFSLEENTLTRMYHVENGERTLVHTLDQGDVTLTLGEDGDFPLPEGNEKLTFCFDAYRVTPGLTYYGTVTEQLSILREDLLARDLALECTDLGNHVYSFTWGETKGDYYEVQKFDAAAEAWQTLCQVGPDEERTYTTGHLPKYSDFRFRVVAVGGQTLPDSDYAAISEDVTVTTGTTAVYCTVWPIQEIEVYSDPRKTQVLGKVPATDGYCVLDVQEGMFRIRYEQDYGYIDSNYCLIDLTEFLGDICLYEITNSYESLYMAHDYELPTVTGEVIVGYEKVKLRSGRQLVPLLYPVALRLEKAAFAAMEQGYKLKIYDAYRPREATKALYDQAIHLSDQPIPAVTYTGKVHTDLPVLEEGQVLTYHDLMTDFGRYTMNYFLAAGKSRHNRGIAIDLTLADLTTGEDLRMQTPMHDLSWYSENARDNKNARILSAIMESVGFTGLRSEWWHFNDLEAQNTLEPQWRWEGVSPECWMADDGGWRYRRSNGEYYVNCTETIDGEVCTFDENGYLVEEQGGSV